VKRKSRLSDSVWTAFTETLRFIIVPLVLLDLVTKNYPLLTTPFMSQIKEYVLFFGAMIVAASTLEVMHKPGSFKRMLFGLGTLAFVCMWLFVIFGGGIAEFTYGPYHVRFGLTKIVYVMFAGICLKGLLVIDTYSVNKSHLIEHDRLRRLEKERARRDAVAAKKAASLRGAAPEFSTLSRLAFEVTHDEGVGYEPPPPPLPPPPSTPSPTRTSRTVKFKVCPVCGEKAAASETVCRNCGAWFARESFRFGKDASENQ
jgi:hypothetical protein